MEEEQRRQRDERERRRREQPKQDADLAEDVEQDEHAPTPPEPVAAREPVIAPSGDAPYIASGFWTIGGRASEPMKLDPKWLY